jgi:hypothetical protein
MKIKYELVAYVENMYEICNIKVKDTECVFYK